MQPRHGLAHGLGRQVHRHGAPGLAAGDQAGVGQHVQVLGHARQLQREGVGQVADRLARPLHQPLQHPAPRGVGQGAEGAVHVAGGMLRHIAKCCGVEGRCQAEAHPHPFRHPWARPEGPWFSSQQVRSPAARLAADGWAPGTSPRLTGVKGKERALCPIRHAQAFANLLPPVRPLPRPAYPCYPRRPEVRGSDVPHIPPAYAELCHERSRDRARRRLCVGGMRDLRLLNSFGVPRNPSRPGLEGFFVCGYARGDPLPGSRPGG